MNRIIHSDALAALRDMPSESVHCCVTSPPYFGLRDYGNSEQIGLEKTPDEYIAKLVEVFRETRRVLRSEGTLWLNIGDSYGSDNEWGGATGGKHAKALHGTQVGRARRFTGVKTKDLIGIPWMLAFALRDDGALNVKERNKIERLISAITASYESIDEWPERIRREVEFLEREWNAAQSGGWYLRQDIIWAKPNPMPESVRDRPTRSHEYIFLLSKSAKYYYDADAIAEKRLTHENRPDGALPQRTENYDVKYGPNGSINRHGSTLEGGDYGRHFLGEAIPEKERRVDKQRGHSRRHAGFNDRWDAMPKEEQCRKANKRDVWNVATQPFPDAHFATFPPKLIVPCIKAGAPEGGTVLDPFMGAGTTALVAKKLGRNYLGIELNADYIAIAEKRLNAVADSLFTA